MNMFNARMLASASVAVIATLALVAPAAAQSTAPVTPSEAEACAKLPTQPERDACVQAQAQAEGTPDEAGDASTIAPGENLERQAESGTIVVTGSRLRRSAFNTPDPLTVIDPELEQKAGKTDTAEIIQSTPAAAGSFQITSALSNGAFVTNGGVGAQTLSLRGLGAERTLTLVNGRRAGPAGTRGSVASFDLNVIPSALVQSVEIVKSGASSIYGSDAIAGVANILTRKSTEGFELRGLVSIPPRGGAETYNISAAYGKEFSRGHVIGGVDLYHRNELERGDRDYFLCPNEYLFTPEGERTEIIDPRTGEPACNGSFANALAINARLYPGSGTLYYGTLQYDNPGSRLSEFLPAIPTVGATSFPSNIRPIFLCQPVDLLSGQPASAADINTCRTAAGLYDPISPVLYGTTVFPKLDRRTAWLDVGFNVTDNIELVGEFLYNNRKTETDGFQQLFFTQFSGLESGTRTPAAQCTAARRATNPNCDPTGVGDPLNSEFTGSYFIQPVIGIGYQYDTDVDYYRAVGGVKAKLGGFLEGWALDSYFQYSRSDGDYTNSRILADAIATQEYRSRRCLPGQVTAVRGVPCMDIDFTDPRVVAGNFTQAERDYLFDVETGNTLYTQLTGEASLTGNLIRLPAGPVGVALGVQWRRDEINDTPGAITLAGNVRSQSTAGVTAGHSTSKEAFGEVEIPLIHNTPFIQNFTVSAAARVVDSYAERDDGLSDEDKGNWTYKVGAVWQVNDWLRFRGSYGTSYRSPALFEQFLGNQSGFQTQAVVDPCINFGLNVARGTLPARIGERCAALGIAPDYSGGGTSSAIVLTGGGIGVLDPETSKSKNFGVVFSPRVGPWEGMRFTVAVDYFDIEVNGEVSQLGPANIVYSCFDSNDYPNDPRCGLFDRDRTAGSTRFNEIITIRDPYLNVDTQKNRGVDLTVRASQDLGRFGQLSVLGQSTWQIADRYELFAGLESDDNGESSEPIFVGDLKTTYTNGPWSVFYGLTVIGGTTDEQDLRDDRGGDVCIDDVIRGDVCPVYRLKPQFYHTMSVTREIGEKFTFSLGVANIFDTKPPRVSGLYSPISALGRTPIFGTQYDQVGRRLFASFSAKI